MRTALVASGFDPTGLQIVGRLGVADPSAKGVREAMEAVPAQVEAGITDLRLRMRLPVDPDEAGDVLSTVIDELSRRTR